jgi:uncharacterized protein (UPF0548 family)
MLLLRKPSDQQLQAFLATQQGAPFSYPGVGATQSQPLAGYAVDHNRAKLGEGQATFERAVAAVRRWEMFNFGWMQLCWPAAPIEPGATVVVLAALLGLWSVNACRIVYTIDDDAGPARRFGFAYGTLPVHEGRGEERFLVEWDRDNNSVCYDILAFSQPNQLLTRLGYPAMRMLQKRFARDSKRAMVRAAAE